MLGGAGPLILETDQLLNNSNTIEHHKNNKHHSMPRTTTKYTTTNMQGVMAGSSTSLASNSARWFSNIKDTGSINGTPGGNINNSAAAR